MRLLPCLILAGLLLAGCDSNDSGMEGAPAARAVLVANGGNFSDQNGSVSTLNLETGGTSTGPAMDGFVQAVVPADTLRLVLVNTFSGGRVDITGPDGTVLASLEDIDAPRAAAIVDGTAYVTTFAFDGSGNVLAIDLATAALTSTFATGSYPEGIAHASGRLIIANYGYIGSGRSVTVIDLADGSAQERSIACDGPRDVVVSGEILNIVCLGKTVYNDDFSQILEQTGGQVHFLNAVSLTELDRIEYDHQFGSTGGGQGAAASASELAVLDPQSEMIRRFELETRTELSAWNFDNEGTYVGLSGIGFGSDRWFVGRMARSAGGPFPDYTAAGQLVEVRAADGSVLAEHGVGQAPTHVAVIIQ
ncbi:MAG: hypothetical protein JJ896_04485 [Rhodothermales bacterium]|nr:hypothetical protein [Rhodothermales bacterium]MBO6778890.1 hypothetical protein [Rhodothermales bacterium]